jgi:hypothetical protein
VPNTEPENYPYNQPFNYQIISSFNHYSLLYILSLYEIEKSNIAEGLEYLGNYMANFFGVPDFKYDIKPFFDVAEALKMIGMG